MPMNATSILAYRICELMQEPKQTQQEALALTNPEFHVSRWPNGGILFGPVVPPPQCGGT